MVTDINGRVWSNLAIHPGETLGEEIEVRGMTQRRLAAELGRPVQVVNEIIRGKKAITADTAVALERVLGISAEAWMNMQATYELTLAYQRAEHAQTEALAAAAVSGSSRQPRRLTRQP